MYAIVEFPTKECAIVPMTWLNEKESKCYWPRKLNKNENFDTMIQEKQPFKRSWPKYRVYKIHLKTSNFIEAKEHLNKLLLNVESEESSESVMSRKAVRIRDDSDVDSTSSSEKEDSPPKKKQLKHVVNIPSTSRICTPTSFRSSPACVNLIDSFSEINTPTSKTPTSDTGSTRTHAGFNEEVINYLTRLNEKVDQQNIVVNEILRTMRNSNVQNLNKPEEVPDFPLNSLEQMQQLENLLEKSDVFSYLVYRLSAVGGSGVDSHTRRILKFLITDEVAILYNWKGRDKLSFQNTKTMTLIYKAVHKSFTKGGVDILVENATKDWLKYAKSRQQKKKGRCSQENKGGEEKN